MKRSLLVLSLVLLWPLWLYGWLCWIVDQDVARRAHPRKPGR